jgi:hypothetical protein
VGGIAQEATQIRPRPPAPLVGLMLAPRRRRATAADAAVQDAPLPEFLLEEAPPAHAVSVLWAFAALLAAAALTGQAAYRYRAELGVLAPVLRPSLEAACRFAGCRVPLPRRPELMSIDSSDLQADTRSETLIVLNALLRNRAPFPQDYPLLELTLTDDADRAVVRRVLAPVDYLDKPRAAGAAQGIAPGAEASLRVNLDTGGVRATGYRLYLFYP